MARLPLACVAGMNVVARAASTRLHSSPVTLDRRKPVAHARIAISRKCGGSCPSSAWTWSRVAHRGSGRSIRNNGTFGAESNMFQSVTHLLRTNRRTANSRLTVDAPTWRRRCIRCAPRNSLRSAALDIDAHELLDRVLKRK